MELLKVYIQEVLGLVPVLWYERVPRDMATQRVMWRVDLFIVHTLVLSSLSYAMPNKEWDCVVANRMTKWTAAGCIMFCRKLGKMYAEIYMITMAFREDSISHTQVFEWFCHFKDGRTMWKEKNVLDNCRQPETVIWLIICMLCWEVTEDKWSQKCFK